MVEESDQADVVQDILKRTKEVFGRVPLVSEVLSERPDLFIPYSEMSKNLFIEPKHMDLVTAELAAIAAGAALSSEHCLGVHIEQALKYGATKDKIMEAMMIGAFMTMNRSNSISLRCLRSIEGADR